MYKVIQIGGKDYRLEYTLEAALYNEGIEDAVDLMLQITDIAAISNYEYGSMKKTLMDAIKTTSGSLPKTALTLFYAGLLENHGPMGDNSVPTIADAKKLVKQYFDEHKDDGTGNFYDLLLICMEQMGADGFFEEIGLTRMLTETNNNSDSKVTKKRSSVK